MKFGERLREEIRTLQSRREALVKQIAEIDAELKEFHSAYRVACKLGAVPEETPPTPSRIEQKPLQNKHFDRRSGPMNRLALCLLKDEFPRGLKSSQIRKIAKDRLEREINENSLTVALGRFKAAGQVRNEGHTWFYVPQEDQKQSEPPAKTSGSDAENAGVV